jgi:hypothetical protein
MRLIGRDYYPRMISRDVQDIFNNRDGNRAADFDALVNRQIANGVVKDRQEFIDKFTHAISGDPHSNDHFSNLERGRQLQLPLDFYDHSPEALLRYAQRANERLAQVGAFGQKLSNKGKDMFDLATDKVNQSGNLSHNAKEAIIRRIADERTAQFNSQQQNGLERMGSAGRNIATGLFLSNQATAFRNLMTGAAQNFVFGGPGSFLKTAAQFPFHWKSMIGEAHDRNILRANLRNVMDDYNLVTNPNWLERGASKFGQWGIAFGGHNLTENINRTFGMQQAKEILRLFARDYGVKDNPITRARDQFVARRFGIRHDENPTRTLSALAREGGNGPLSDEFLRQYVMDVHANYGPSQSPAHIFNSPVGKALTQFQRWSANTSRMATREYLMPLTRAIQSGSPSEIGYHALRSIGYLAAGAGVMLPTQAILNAIYHRDPKDPTLAEIGKQFQKGDNAQALQWGLAKLYGLVQMSGFTGLFGNTADVIQNTLGFDPSGRLKDPLHPPSFGVLEPWLALFGGIKGEGFQRAMQDPKLWNDFANKLSSTYRTGRAAVLGTANSAGIKIPWSEAYAAQNTRNFARDRIAMYEAQNPVLQQKAEQRGTQAPFTQMAGRKPFDPTGDRIINGLLSGHGEDVNSAIREWLSSVPMEQRKAEYNRIKAKINDNSPLKVGGSTKPEAVMQFLDWARGNLPEGEARRIYSLASTYAQTALSTGMEDKSKGMNALAKLDYDKAQSVRAPSVAAAAQQQAQNAAQGRQVMAELVKRQRAAQALQGR